MQLSAADEFFTHQTSLPHTMVASSDPSWRERYWISVQDVLGGDTVLTIGLGKYPNTDVMEAFAVLSHEGTQHNLRLSRTLLPRSTETTVGPLRVEVIEPLRELRLILEENETGVEFDIRWSATTEALLEGRFFQISRARVTYDAIRYVQHGRAAGTIRGAGLDAELTPDRWWGVRDHSWGTRPLPRAPGMPPGERPEWRMLLFAPLQLPDFGVHLYLQESKVGRAVHLSAGLTPRIGGDPEPEAIVAVEHDLTWESGAAAPTLSGGTIGLRLSDGREIELGLRALAGRAHLRGGGYEGWNGWFQGQWRGEDTAESEAWDLNDSGNIYRYAKAGSDHLVEVTHGADVGYGIIEYMVLPGYDRYAEAMPPEAGDMSDPHSQLYDFLADQLGEGVDIWLTDPEPIVGGSSKVIWACNAEWHTGDDFEFHADLIIRQDAAAGVVESDLRQELALLEFLDGRLPVPSVFGADPEGTFFGRPTMVVERSPGQAHRAVLRDKDPLGLGAEGRLSLARDLVDLLASVHAFEGADLADVLPDPGTDPADHELTRWEGQLEEKNLDPENRLRPARDWLHAHLPGPPATLRLVHGDFRPANVLVDEGEISILLDWELAHIGDAADDLGWYTCSIYRVEHFPEGWTVDDFLARYVEEGGTEPEPERLRFWQVLSVFRLAVIALRSARNIEQGLAAGLPPPVDRLIGQLLADIA